jgi:hypothetical protein
MMMICKIYLIKYCQKKDGKFIEVTPDIAHYFRVYSHDGKTKRFVKSFPMLSLANKYIREKMAE